jgi:hypothetical protein
MTPRRKNVCKSCQKMSKHDVIKYCHFHMLRIKLLLCYFSERKMMNDSTHWTSQILFSLLFCYPGRLTSSYSLQVWYSQHLKKIKVTILAHPSTYLKPLAKSLALNKKLCSKLFTSKYLLLWSTNRWQRDFLNPGNSNQIAIYLLLWSTNRWKRVFLNQTNSWGNWSMRFVTVAEFIHKQNMLPGQCLQVVSAGSRKSTNKHLL